MTANNANGLCPHSTLNHKKHMQMKKKKQPIALLAMKAARKASREEEIRLHGKPIHHNRTVVSKKVYNRKKDKADRQRGLPSFLYTGGFYKFPAITIL